MTTQHSAIELQQYLDQQRPGSLLALLGDDEIPLALRPYKAAALFALDRPTEAQNCLEPALEGLSGDEGARAQLLHAELMIGGDKLDAAILAAEQAAQMSSSPHIRAEALGWVARGLARKRCWSLAETTLREALALAPDDLEVMYAQGRVALLLDQRLDARAAYERMAKVYPGHAAWGLALVAYLLGEFDIARTHLGEALAASDEIVHPLFLQAQLALITADLPALEEMVAELERRSPQSESLPAWREVAADLRRRLATSDAQRARLTAFPTTMQRRDHCGPCTIELVLRYWSGGLDLTNDQIAQAVKFPGGGTPVYRMREFFHLVGFDTVRCRAGLGQLKHLIDAGYPVIVEEEFPNTAHVSVVIGYDDRDATILFQDPMTHVITHIPANEVNRLRRTSLDGALVAFPYGQGHDHALALMDLYDDQAIVWLDQACLALDEGRLQEAATLAARAIQRQPDYRLAWMVRLAAELQLWEQVRQQRTWPAGSIAASLAGDHSDDRALCRDRFYAALAQAELTVPDAAVVHQYAGRAALLDGNYTKALASFQRAAELAPQDARTLAALAECHYAMRTLDRALEYAEQAVLADPTLSAANIWMARCLAARDDTRAQHYARCAVEQAPNWWLAHLAQAETHLVRSAIDDARRAVGIAHVLAPEQEEVKVLRGVLLAAVGAWPDAAAELEEVLLRSQAMTPMSIYTARRTICRILFGARRYDDAAVQVASLLELAPDDPWGLQFRAAACAGAHIAAGRTGDAHAIAEVRALYEAALAANRGEPWIVRDYVEYLVGLAGLDQAIETAASLRNTYPNRGLSYTYGRLLGWARRMEEAAAAMVDALGQWEGIDSNDAMHEAIATILEGMGLEAGAQAVLAVVESDLKNSEGERVRDEDIKLRRAARERVLGLQLADEAEAVEQARMLLQAAIAANPDDASVTLRLGDVAETEEMREALYRRALMLMPSWSYARYRLAHYLNRNDRPMEALELTSGHEGESIELMEIHARSLLQVGRYEEAATAYSQVMAMAEETPPWLCYYTWLAQHEAGQHEMAAETAQQAVERFDDDPSWYVQLGRSLTCLGDYEKARQVAEQGRVAGMSELDAQEIAYEIAWAQHDLTAALAVVDQVLPTVPQQEEMLNEWERRRLRLLIDLGHLNEARQLVHTRSLSTEGLGYAAWTVMQAEHWPLLLELAEQILARDPMSFTGLFAQATALRGLDRETEAVEAYHLLRRTHPDEHNAYEKLGFLLALEGNTDEALKLADRAVALGPFCYMAWATRGYVYLVRGEEDKALADLETAWNRADIDHRRGAPEFWWVRSALQNDREAAVTWREQATAKATTNIDQRHIAQIEMLLASRHSTPVRQTA